MPRCMPNSTILAEMTNLGQVDSDRLKFRIGGVLLLTGSQFSFNSTQLKFICKEHNSTKI